ncbi:MAG: DUF1858 domain-containing protein [Tissierellia bacterium]|nr:DUF1858 domain-containing protein [Tissierellia bacterium]
MEREEVLITKDMKINEVIRIKPRTLGTLMNFGLGCIGCPASQMETIEQAAAVHGLDLDYLIKALNS